MTIKEICIKYKHVLWALLFPVYIVLYYIAESVVTVNYWNTATALDAYIPFLDFFVIPYSLWYPAMLIVGLYLIFKDPPGFKKYMLFLGLTCYISAAMYFILPNGQDLRPASFENSNFYTGIIGWLYSSDTNTNVFPSVHVTGSMAVLAGIWEGKGLKKVWIRISAVIITALISVSTVFIKQHAVIDIFASLAVSALVYVIIYVPGKIKAKKSISL